MSEDEPPATSAELKKKIASAAGVNEKTVERQSRNLMTLLWGVSEKELQDPYLRAYIRWKLFGEDPSPYIIVEKNQSEEAATKDE